MLTLVLPPPAAEDLPWDTPLLGLPLLSRSLLAAERAGFTRRVVLGERPPPLPAGVEAVPPSEPVTIDAGRLVVLSPRVVATVKGLRALASGAGHPGEARLLGERLAAVGDLESPLRLAGASFDAFAAALAARLPVGVERAPLPEGLHPVTSRDDLGGVEDWLLAGLVKDSEGFMSRHFERKVSLAVSRRLSRTRVTPNAMTVVSVLVGLSGALFFLRPGAAAQLTGALLFLLHSILDGCDGELARLKFLESRWGGVLDFWGDNVVHVAVFLAIGAGWSRELGRSWPLALGVVAASTTVLTAGWVYLRTMRGAKEGPLFTGVVPEARSRLARVAEALSHRDFIYLVVILSGFGKAGWFLLLAAAGAPVFLLVLLFLGLREQTASNGATPSGFPPAPSGTPS